MDRFRQYLHYAKKYRRPYIVGSVYLLVTNALGLSLPQLLRAAVNELESTKDLTRVGHFAVGMIVVALLQAFVRTLSRLQILGACRRVTFDIRKDMFSRLLTLDRSFYSKARTGDLMSKAVNDVRVLQGLYGPAAMNILNTAIAYVAVVILLLRIDVSLTLISLSIYPPLAFAIRKISMQIYVLSRSVQDKLGHISDRAQESISGIQMVKIFHQEEREILDFQRLCSEFREKSLQMAFRRAVMIAIIGIAAGAGAFVVLYLGGTRLMRGEMTLGDFIAFNAYLAILIHPTIAIGWIVNVIQRSSGAMDRIQAIIKAKPLVPSPMIEDDAKSKAGFSSIRVSDLSFELGGTRILDNISFEIRQGERVAIVGEVGSGKSILTSLFMHLYPVSRGCISFDGIDINDVDIESLRRGIGFVSQEPFLFSMSLRENISYGKPDATEEEVMWAVEVSGLSGDIESLPRGLDTVVGERGFTLSGGQRQRVTLARALLSQAEIFIFDDALSSVDAKTEKNILKALSDEMSGLTCLFITHRYSTLQGFDRILVLKDGRLVENGSHDELMATASGYQRMFQASLLREELGAT